jgi:hypothetical protein
MSSSFELHFRGLPRELRDKIWRKLLVGNLPYRPSTLALDINRLNTTYSLALIRKAYMPITPRRDPIHLTLFLANKQIYHEASHIFYSCNEFITCIVNLLNLLLFGLRIRPGIRRLRLEFHTKYSAWFNTIKPRNMDLSFATHRLTHLTVRMPCVQPILLSEPCDIIGLSLMFELVEYLRAGLIKTIKLVFPGRYNLANILRRMALIIKTLLKSKHILHGPFGEQLQVLWFTCDDDRTHHEILRRSPDDPRPKFFHTFDKQTRIRGDVVLTLSRVEDQPVQKETVDRPKVVIVSNYSHLKRNAPASPKTIDPRPLKIPRYSYPQCMAFSESRTNGMPRRAVRDRHVGKTAQLRRLIEDKGPEIVPIPRETYRWKEPPSSV